MSDTQQQNTKMRAESRPSSDMPATVGTGGGSRHYRAPSRVATLAARSLGLRPETVHQSVYGHSPVHHRLATILEAAIGLGDHAMIERLMRPIDHVLSRRAPSPFGPALINEEQAAEAAMNSAKVRCLAEPSRETMRGWLLEVRRERADLLRLDAAITAKLEGRGQP